ncbi:hypothetical protein Tco_0537122 [Tanacetum coccineum]
MNPQDLIITKATMLLIPPLRLLKLNWKRLPPMRHWYKTPSDKSSHPMAWRILLNLVIQVLRGNHSSTEQLNSIQQLISYNLLTGTKVSIKEIIFSDLVTRLMAKSRQGREASGALPQKRKKSKTQTTTLIQGSIKPPKEKVQMEDSNKTHSEFSRQSTHPQDIDGNTKPAIK